MDKNKILKMVAVLALILVIAGSLSRLAGRDSMSLSEYAALNASPAPAESASPENTSLPPAAVSAPPVSALTGASLNGISQQEQRSTYTEGFYYEPLSDNLRRYITGVTYFMGQDTDSGTVSAVSLDELRYVHIWHYNFQGKPAEGELICHKDIARDLVEIFYELYRNEYQLNKVLLADEYDGDADAAREDNNSFCFYTPPDAENTSVSKHAAGLALDINPYYNPRIVYENDGSETILPASAAEYADRTAGFPYKIDENDLCCRLFLQHGFTWGGNRNNGKDYQHFQKALP